MSIKMFFLSLIGSLLYNMWLFDVMNPGLILSLALVMIATVLVVPKVLWILMVKWPGAKKGASALAEHRNKHPESYGESP